MYSLSRLQQVMQLLPWGTFDAAVDRHRADRHCKRFTSRKHLLAMTCAQLSDVKSLRVLEDSFNPHVRQHYHLNAEPIRRSTLADANAKRSPLPFAETAAALMKQAGRSIRAERQWMLYLLDSTTIQLRGRGFDWTHANATRDRGLKVHVLYAAHTQHLAHHSITGVNVNDLDEGKRLTIEPGATYVFDKGYCDYGWWERFNQAGARFVTRAKVNIAVTLVREQAIDPADRGVILSDRIEQFKHKANRGGHRNTYCGQIRRVEVARADGAPLRLVTNDLGSPASEIAQLYKDRWKIELLFKWIKQHLQVKRFLGRSENAVRIQLLVALIVYLLVLLYKNKHQPHRSLWHVLAELRHGLMVPVQTGPSSWKRDRDRQAYIRTIQPRLL
jgi:putative transposase